MLKFKRSSRIGYLNYYLFQFFFCRLAKTTEKKKIIALAIMFPVIPLTGWIHHFNFGLKVPMFFIWRKNAKI